MLFLEPQDLDYRNGVIEDGALSELRRQAADAHPDRGGDPAEFRVVYARYLAAKKRAS